MAERVIEVGTRDHAEAVAIDEPGPGGANHQYMIREVVAAPQAPHMFAHVKFQVGPVGEAGINGCQNEQMVAIVIDRLSGFQSGEFACPLNAEAMHHFQNGLSCLHARTKDRKARGVEGESKP